ncbi:ABC transporter substrate-binding protein [Nesterenkonia natronophila]|uniref:Glycine/betaine ABC transporter substrate-binding protein n=1 Tax=Nesterenkonia natronophila TaxID=2174932 RepID=A0A3A4G306_9MICC|nr:glycine betaine ABC transporter substrate-binding protein [Nesterenkonia natronophila]RJN32599.1 glycine/betaine ABC transporter substrate-binding protein [Nesterenkonia natronophila]
MTNKRTWAPGVAGGGLAMLLALTACGDAGNGEDDNGGELAGETFTVGSKEFTESYVLGYISALLLEDAGAETVDQTGISGTATVRAALESEEIDLYWDYTGTGWVDILGNTTEDLPDDLYQAVAEADEENGIAWLEPANFENTYRIATTESFASEQGLSTMTEAADYINENPDENGLCAASEFINRDDGLPGLEEAYDVDFDAVELDLNLIYPQVGDSCEFGEVFSTDARIEANDLIVLDDDQDFFVPYEGALTLRQETLDEHPAIEELHQPVSEALTDEVVMELNGRVDTGGEDPRDVAEDWLMEQGFID